MSDDEGEVVIGSITYSIDDFHSVLNIVARERGHLTTLDASPLAEMLAFGLRGIDSGDFRNVATA